MQIPKALVVEHGAYATDGGSIHLSVRDPGGTAHSVLLAQHMVLEEHDPACLPGRLYFDSVLVPIRSDAEAQLISVLRHAKLQSPPEAGEVFRGDQLSANRLVSGRDIEEYLSKVDEGPEAALAHLVRELMAFVESDEYTRLAHDPDEPGGSA